MWSSALRFSGDVSAAGWLRSALVGPPGGITGTIPAGYPAYARICHAAPGPNGPVSWAAVATVTGRQVHPLMQWHALLGATDPSNPDGSRWPPGDPDCGNLDQDQLGALCGILAQHTTTIHDCCFCLWEGWGWIHGSPAVASLGSDERVPPAFPDEVISGPRVRLPGRDYLLFTGPLAGALDAGWRPRPDWLIPQSPNLFWPADRAWCVATEIDFDSTLVAGDHALIEAILASSSLDAWPVNPHDSLTSTSDRINSTTATE